MKGLLHQRDYGMQVQHMYVHNSARNPSTVKQTHPYTRKIFRSEDTAKWCRARTDEEVVERTSRNVRRPRGTRQWTATIRLPSFHRGKNKLK